MIEQILNALFDHKVIVNCDRDPYLHRWFLIRRARLGLFLHKFVRSDEDRALHDHPWNFLVVPIWRGYVEHTETLYTGNPDIGAIQSRLHTVVTELGVRRYLRSRRRVWPIIGTRLRPATFRHRVELIKGRPAWSLFFRFKKWREWGFWPAEGFTLWNKWWQDKCE